ncbi:MAG: ABC transporter permease [Thermoplasmata archaeon]|nr:ABC transporter permease [Thermoplasmata archaeon]
MKKALVISWRRLAEIWHQKKLLAFLILYPLIFMIIFGSVFGGENYAISFKMAIVTESSDDMTSLLISIFQEYEGIDVAVKSPGNESMEELAKELIENEDFLAVLFIPENFSQVIFSTAKITVFYDESADINTRSIAIGTIGGIIDAFSQEIAEKKIEMAKEYGNLTEEEIKYMESIARPINLSLVGYSPVKKELKYIDFLVPGLISMTIMWTGVTGVASSLVEDRVRGVRQRILSSPVSRISVIAGESIGYVIITGIQIVILLLIAVLAFKITIAGEIWLLAAVIIVGMLCMIGIGLTISSIAKTAEEASQLGMLINFPMMFLSGIFFPITQGWMYYVSRFFPLTYINEAMREVILRGGEFGDIAVPFFVSLTFAILIFIIGVALLMRREEE